MRVIERVSPHAPHRHSVWSLAAVQSASCWKLSLSPSLCRCRSVSLALARLGGGVPVWRSRVIDGSICVCVITAGLIGREEHWDIVITDTPGQPLTHADGGRDSLLHRGRDGGGERGVCVSVCLHGKGVKRHESQAE